MREPDNFPDERVLNSIHVGHTYDVSSYPLVQNDIGSEATNVLVVKGVPDALFRWTTIS
jgi:hypothetical protein